MEGIWRILALTLVLAISSFLVGVLPLSFTFSEKRKHQLSTFGNGLLLGAALGVIIPEGIESVSGNSASPPTSTIALSLLVGFALMLIVEQYLAPHAPPSIAPPNPHESYEIASPTEERMEYDMRPIAAEISALPRSLDRAREDTRIISLSQQIMEYPLTLGLVIHSLADGLALGASAAGEDSSDMSLSLVVFFALIIHKSPTALALTSSLMSTPLPRSEIRKHVAVFSIATPLGAIFSYCMLIFVGSRAGGWTGVALLISGGTFLYVATVLQPISSHSHDNAETALNDDSNEFQRVSFLVLGIFLPFCIGSLFGHGHEHAHTR